MSDRLVDAIVAWGSPADVQRRIDEHFAAGATHVCVLPLSTAGGNAPDIRALEAVAAESRP